LKKSSKKANFDADNGISYGSMAKKKAAPPSEEWNGLIHM
jgi:hypothetical protein